MQVDEMLQPHRSIGDCAGGLRLSHSALSYFHLGQLLKRARINHARKIGQMGHLLEPTLAEASCLLFSHTVQPEDQRAESSGLGP